MVTNQRDAAVQQVTPTVAAPRYQAFEKLAEIGQRYVVTGDGLKLEIARSWVHAVVPVARVDTGSTPYGDVESRVSLKCGELPVDLLQRFKEEARKHCPNEHAAWITWSSIDSRFRYRDLSITRRTPDALEYQTPLLDEGEVLIVDVHSHGIAGPCFSKADDRDDFGKVKLAVVYGNCHLPQMTFAIRLCALGHFVEGSPLLGMLSYEAQT